MRKLFLFHKDINGFEFRKVPDIELIKIKANLEQIRLPGSYKMFLKDEIGG